MLLQKPSSKSKPREHVSCLECRLQCWRDGDNETFLGEGKTIQSRLFRSSLHPNYQESTTRVFARLMFQGKTEAVCCLITEQNVGSVLHLDSNTSGGVGAVHDALLLLLKHPPGCPASASVLLNTTAEPPDVHPVVSGRGGRVGTGVNGGCGDGGKNNGGHWFWVQLVMVRSAQEAHRSTRKCMLKERTECGAH